MQINKAKREQIFNKFNRKCAYCGNDITISKMQIDHIIPKEYFVRHVKNKINVPYFLKHLTEFDVNNMDNLFPSCGSCNNYKHSNYLELFRMELQEQLKRLNDRSTNYKLAKRFNQLIETPTPILFYFEKIIK